MGGDMSNSKNKKGRIVLIISMLAFDAFFIVALITALRYGHISIKNIEAEIESEKLLSKEGIAENQEDVEQVWIELEELRSTLKQELLVLLEEKLVDNEEKLLTLEEEIIALNAKLEFIETRLSEIEITSAQNVTNVKANFSFIPKGDFKMGTNEGPFSSWGPTHAVYLSAFWMQNYEVTNLEFSEFLNIYGNQRSPDGDTWLKEDGKNLHIYLYDGRWNVDEGYENHPVVQVSWYGATAYCDYIGGRLPTEAEWEKAARGGLEGAIYPWGNNNSVCTPGAENGAQSDKCGGGIRSVGSFTPNGYGLYDMAGNLWEWVSDWYGENYYSISPYENPLGPDYGERRSCRGGAWDSWYLEVATRNFCGPQAHNDYLGFRCVID